MVAADVELKPSLTSMAACYPLGLGCHLLLKDLFKRVIGRGTAVARRLTVEKLEYKGLIYF